MKRAPERRSQMAGRRDGIRTGGTWRSDGHISTCRGAERQESETTRNLNVE